MQLTALVSSSLLAFAVPPGEHRPQHAHLWVFFDDRPAQRSPFADAFVTPRALERRERRERRMGSPAVPRDHDRPVDAGCVAAVTALGGTVRLESRWLNAVSVAIDPAQRAALESLPFVRHVAPVRSARRGLPPTERATGGVADIAYGASYDQIAQADLLALHARDFRGAGIVIGVLDTGFNRVHEAFHSDEHPLEVIAEWDFINNDSNTGIERGDEWFQHRHGTWTLGVLAAYLPGQLVGAAYEASYVLAKTEVVGSETKIEEDYYVAGLEFIEAQGADLATSSLGYNDWYDPEDFDGATAVTTIAVNIATSLGLVCVTSGGNGGHDDDPSTHHLGAPADAFDVIACGAVDAAGDIADFSSDGPTADGRVKPELLARGVETATIHSTDPTGLSSVNGTSFSAPIIAGAAACILQARPEFRVGALRGALFATATDLVITGMPDPLFIRGYGIVQADAAAGVGRSIGDINLDASVDSADLAILLGAWGTCSDCAACPSDLNGDCQIDALDLSVLLGAWS
ncbi:MAG: S8 family serine peptidase [Phycisphaerae bacterium]|nr:S8 family serine peptidase [Phycisphaerae bacterium]